MTVELYNSYGNAYGYNPTNAHLPKPKYPEELVDPPYKSVTIKNTKLFAAIVCAWSRLKVSYAK